MTFPPLHEAVLLRRYKRFLADVRFVDGTEVTVHCANPGRMTSCLEEGGRIWLSHHPGTKRKLLWSWELAEVGDATILINTARANRVVEEALRSGQVPGLAGEVKPEVKVGDSRLDFRVGDGFVEVKSVTLLAAPRVASFPDAPTERGRKHLAELRALCEGGTPATLIFLLGRDDADCIRPADAVDPAYGVALRRAASAGVGVIGLRTAIDTQGMQVVGTVPVQLS